MAITDKKTGVWGLDQVYNKENQGSIWTYSGANQLKATGKNTEGQLGQNSTVGYSSPIQIPGTWDGVLTANWYSVGSTKSDGTMWAWGKNSDYGQLGLNDRTNRSSPVQVPGTTWPTVDGKLCFFDDATMAIKTDGTLWMWGNNETYNAGKLGQNNETNYSSPVQVGSDTTWSAVTGGNRCVSAIKTDGTLWSWGSNSYGLFGTNQTAAPIGDDGNTTKRSSPVQVPGTTWSKMPYRSYLTRYAIKTDGTLWAWGFNDTYGALGVNNRTEYSSPVQIPGTTWSSISCGRVSSAAIKTNGTLWVWGSNSYGELGQNQASAQLASISSPVQIPGTTWSKLGAGFYNVAASKTDGTLWAWGNNARGPLGQNNVVNYSSPVQIPGTIWDQISASNGNNAETFILTKRV